MSSVSIHWRQGNTMVQPKFVRLSKLCTGFGIFTFLAFLNHLLSERSAISFTSRDIFGKSHFSGIPAECVQREVKSARKFVYLVQTAECLPQRLLESEAIGDGHSCDCDVIVLSYKRQCGKVTPSHVSYTFKKKVSWNEGRNLLYYLSKRRTKQYLYYIFTDDDLNLAYDDSLISEDLRSIPPMRAFEQFLLRNGPAVGIPNYIVHHSAEIMLQKRSQLCPNLSTRVSTKSDHVPVTHFDASFNAFHRDAISYLLPYPTEYDHICWWHSQRHIIAAAELVFRGHVWMYAPITANNTQHADYPRDDSNASRVWSGIVRRLSRTLPVEFQRSALVRRFIKNPVQYTETSRAVCFDYPPLHPLKPYAHFRLQ